MAGLPDSHYFRHPIRPNELVVMDQAELWIYHERYLCQGIFSCNSHHEASLFGDLEKKQLTNLVFATLNFSFDRDRTDDENYIPDLNAWSTNLLRRYILASGQAEPFEIAMLDNVYAEDLRAIVRAVQKLLVWGKEKDDFLRLAPPRRTLRRKISTMTCTSHLHGCMVLCS
jgi:hypothetical protein